MSAVSTRRDLLTGITVAGIGSIVPVGVAPVAAEASDAKLRALVERWRARDAECSARPPGLTDDEADARIDAIADGMGEIADAIADTPAESIVGVLLKLETSDAILGQDEDYGHGRMLLTAIEDLRRMAGRTGLI